MARFNDSSTGLSYLIFGICFFLTVLRDERPNIR